MSKQIVVEQSENRPHMLVRCPIQVMQALGYECLATSIPKPVCYQCSEQNDDHKRCLPGQR
jgi:hypothetical protein